MVLSNVAIMLHGFNVFPQILDGADNHGNKTKQCNSFSMDDIGNFFGGAYGDDSDEPRLK